MCAQIRYRCQVMATVAALLSRRRPQDGDWCSPRRMSKRPVCVERERVVLWCEVVVGDDDDDGEKMGVCFRRDMKNGRICSGTAGVCVFSAKGTWARLDPLGTRNPSRPPAVIGPRLGAASRRVWARGAWGENDVRGASGWFGWLNWATRAAVFFFLRFSRRCTFFRAPAAMDRQARMDAGARRLRSNGDLGGDWSPRTDAELMITPGASADLRYR